MGIVDYASTSTSRELISAFTENRTFIAEQYITSEQALGQQVEQGKITAGVVIPPDFNRDLSQGQTAEIQVLIDGVDANMAGIASSYISQTLNQYSRQQLSDQATALVKPQVIFLYNPDE